MNTILESDNYDDILDRIARDNPNLPRIYIKEKLMNLQEEDDKEPVEFTRDR